MEMWVVATSGESEVKGGAFLRSVSSPSRFMDMYLRLLCVCMASISQVPGYYCRISPLSTCHSNSPQPPSTPLLFVCL